MNYEALLAALLTLVIVAMILERGLSVLFQWRWWKKYCDGLGLKTIVALAISWAICTKYGFDFFAMGFAKDPSVSGYLVTAMFVSGGSKLILSVIHQIRAFKDQDGGNKS